MEFHHPERWCCQSAALNMPAHLENSAVATGLKKVSFHSNPKERLNYCTIALISHASKVMLKILQARLQQYVNYEIPDVQAVFRKGRETRGQIANICWIIERESSRKKSSISALLTMPKPLTVWITTNYGKFLKRWEYQTTWPASWEICMQDKKQQLELDMKQQHGSKSGKEYIKAVYCHPAYLTYMYHMKSQAGWSTTWNQDFWEKYQ